MWVWHDSFVCSSICCCALHKHMHVPKLICRSDTTYSYAHSYVVVALHTQTRGPWLIWRCDVTHSFAATWLVYMLLWAALTRACAMTHL